jgi:predicted  nucleic acid-binding Zn-ribbon protein
MNYHQNDTMNHQDLSVNDGTKQYDQLKGEMYSLIEDYETVLKRLEKVSNRIYDPQQTKEAENVGHEPQDFVQEMRSMIDRLRTIRADIYDAVHNIEKVF